jgi:tetratricopeptide (TPR) repeat protein
MEREMFSQTLKTVEAQYREELARPQGASFETTFNYAFLLHGSNLTQDLHMAVNLLQGLLATDSSNRELLYTLAETHNLLREYREARLYCQQLLEKEPGNRQAKDLLEAIEARTTEDGILGLAIVGVGVAATALGVFAFSRLLKR